MSHLTGAAAPVRARLRDQTLPYSRNGLLSRLLSLAIVLRSFVSPAGLDPSRLTRVRYARAWAETSINLHRLEYTFVPSGYMKVYVTRRWAGVLSPEQAEAIRAALAAARQGCALSADPEGRRSATLALNGAAGKMRRRNPS